MHFLSANGKKIENYEEKQVSGRYFLNATDGDRRYVGTEVQAPVKYFVGKVENGIFYKETMEEARLMKVEMFMDGDEVSVEHEIEYEKIIGEFGDKKAKERMKKRALHTSVGEVQKIKYSQNDNLVDAVGKDARLENIFEKPFIDKSKEIVHALDNKKVFEKMCRTYALKELNEEENSGNVEVFTKKCLLVLLDFVTLVLDLKFIIKVNVPDKYSGLFGIVCKDVCKNKLARLGKDKLISKLYLMLLMYNDGELHIDALPRFKYPKTKFITLLKSLDCIIDKKGMVKFR